MKKYLIISVIPALIVAGYVSGVFNPNTTFNAPVEIRYQGVQTNDYGLQVKGSGGSYVANFANANGQSVVGGGNFAAGNTDLNLSALTNWTNINLRIASRDKIKISVDKIKLYEVENLAPRENAPVSCELGDLYADNSGALCFCSSANVWENMGNTGNCQ